MRRQDTIATGGSITGIASRLKQVALQRRQRPARVRKHIEAEIASLHEELDQLDAGQRPKPDVTDCYDEARAIALQMERLITDIGQYGTMIEQATAALDEPIDTNVEYRDRQRQRQMYEDWCPRPSPPVAMPARSPRWRSERSRSSPRCAKRCARQGTGATAGATSVCSRSAPAHSAITTLAVF